MSYGSSSPAACPDLAAFAVAHQLGSARSRCGRRCCPSHEVVVARPGSATTRARHPACHGWRPTRSMRRGSRRRRRTRRRSACPPAPRSPARGRGHPSRGRASRAAGGAPRRAGARSAARSAASAPAPRSTSRAGRRTRAGRGRGATSPGRPGGSPSTFERGSIRSAGIELVAAVVALVAAPSGKPQIGHVPSMYRSGSVRAVAANAPSSSARRWRLAPRACGTRHERRVVVRRRRPREQVVGQARAGGGPRG